MEQYLILFLKKDMSGVQKWLGEALGSKASGGVAASDFHVFEGQSNETKPCEPAEFVAKQRTKHVNQVCFGDNELDYDGNQ